MNTEYPKIRFKNCIIPLILIIDNMIVRALILVLYEDVSLSISKMFNNLEVIYENININITSN